MKKPLLALLLVSSMAVLTPRSAHADQGITIFGINIGKELDPEQRFALCKKPAGFWRAERGNGPCLAPIWNSDEKLVANVRGVIGAQIIWPLGEGPRLVGDVAIVSISDKKIQSLGIRTTGGMTTALMVLEELTAKFGKPSYYRSKTVQNGLGLSFDAFDAGWDVNGVNIFFESIEGKIDSGIIRISTQEGRDEKRKVLESINSDRPKW